MLANKESKSNQLERWHFLLTCTLPNGLIEEARSTPRTLYSITVSIPMTQHSVSRSRVINERGSGSARVEPDTVGWLVGVDGPLISASGDEGVPVRRSAAKKSMRKVRQSIMFMLHLLSELGKLCLHVSWQWMPYNCGCATICYRSLDVRCCKQRVST